MVGDSIADLIIRIKNAGAVKHATVDIPYSKLKYQIARKLQDKKYLAEVEKKGTGIKKHLTLTLTYDPKDLHRVHDVKRLSKPGQRIYYHMSDIMPVKQGKGLLILSTSKGILTGEEARKEQVGGEALFSIW